MTEPFVSPCRRLGSGEAGRCGDKKHGITWDPGVKCGRRGEMSRERERDRESKAVREAEKNVV